MVPTNNELSLEFCFKLLKFLLFLLTEVLWKQPTENKRGEKLNHCNNRLTMLPPLIMLSGFLINSGESSNIFFYGYFIETPNTNVR